MTSHFEDELSSLLAGELSGDETRALAAHLRECGECTSALVAVAVAHGSLRAARRSMAPSVVASPVTDAPLPALVLPRRRVASWMRAAAAVVVVVALSLGVALGVTHHSSPGVAAVASLHHLDAPSSAAGRVTVHATSEELLMHVVTAGLPPLAANHFYEVWLLQPRTNKMLALGVLSVTGTSTFTISRPLMSQFSAVDISLQDNNGRPEHSSTSVLRGQVIAV